MLPALLLAAALRHRAVAPPSDPPPESWFPQHAIALSETSDLGPFAQLVGDARVVALGDATHGTHELFALKLRLVPYLIEHAGFRTVALEGPYELEKLDRYVKTGEGDPAAALQVEAYFWWHVQEMLDLVHWIRAWNAAGNPTVTIGSIDSVIPNAATDAIVAYLRRVDNAAADRAATRYDCLAVYWQNNSYSITNPASQAACREGVLAVRPELEARRTDYERATSHDDFEVALHAARVAEQVEESFATNRLSRDRTLAENVLWHAARAKTVIIGHMVHFGRLEYDFVAPHTVPAGVYLTQALGSDYVSIASATYSGMVNVVINGAGVVSAEIPPPPQTDVAQILARARMPSMLVPLHNAPSWLAGKQQWRIAPTNVASIAKPTITIEGELVAGYDALIYVESTTATRLLP